MFISKLSLGHWFKSGSRDFFLLIYINHFKNLNKKFAKDGVRTHAHIRELDLKSNALTTRPPGLIQVKLKLSIHTIGNTDE